MEITNPRRILAISLESEAELLSRFVKDLTGTHPTPLPTAPPEGGEEEEGGESSSSGSGLAGTTHALTLKTAYYSAEVPVWLDTPAAPGEWADTFLSAEAREVLSVLGGIAIVFSLKGEKEVGGGKGRRELVEAVGRVVREGLGGWEWDGVGLAVGFGEVGPDAGDVLGDWEEACGEAGLEFVHARSGGGGDKGRNEFGEKTGIPRVLEALQSNDWALDLDADGLGLGDDDDDDDDFMGQESSDEFGDFEKAASGAAKRRKSTDLDPASLSFGFDKADFEGLKHAIWSSGVDTEADAEDKRIADEAPSLQESSQSQKDATDNSGSSSGEGHNAKDPQSLETEDDIGKEDVEKVEAMMRKLLAVREMGASLPEEQRKRLAARAVGEVMRDL
ncbi:hypothetical protein PpBr36_03220 [Pyricularia pennisetigena]|uniref:hypothetical protein n=1 Tax=Pyricularia pennisetigena TaxID=1578925 RepID=UPI0011514E06|nr:hypothetical protein PpBr36_03220 [Pyricularia pennisetigena]TLS31185.1 hypothetical protein PpBr36_03220 [Pyricularia pennisetigena]